MRGIEALIFINGHWQEMSYALAFSEAKLMTKDDFYKAFGTIADRTPIVADMADDGLVIQAE